MDDEKAMRRYRPMPIQSLSFGIPL